MGQRWGKESNTDVQKYRLILNTNRPPKNCTHFPHKRIAFIRSLPAGSVYKDFARLRKENTVIRNFHSPINTTINILNKYY